MSKRVVTLSDEREIEIDLFKITRIDYRALTAAGSTAEEENRVIGLATGLSEKELDEMREIDFSLIVRTLIIGVQTPLAVPNSPSESTSDSPKKK